jgi:hypothetical protein
MKNLEIGNQKAEINKLSQEKASIELALTQIKE